jgi:hypothetical protein
LLARPVYAAGFQQRVPLNLTSPVDDHARRADNQEMRSAPGRQVAHGGKRLHRLAKAHLVAEDHPLLNQRELRAERLVATQRCLDPGLVEGMHADLLGDLGGEEALAGFLDRVESPHPDQQTVVRDWAGEVIAP